MDLYRLPPLQMYVSLYVKYPKVLSDFYETWILSADLSKNNAQNIKFRENPSSGSRIVPCGRIKVIVALRNFANAPKRSFRFSAARLEWYVGPRL